jgi:plastocyanin
VRAFLFAAAIALAGCGDDSTAPPRFDLSMPPMLDLAALPDLAINASAVVQVGPGATNAFVPSTVTINAGETVAWRWVTGTHSIVSDASAFDSSPVQSSGIFATKFPTAGTFPYHCGIHGQMMTGTIVVQ